MDSYAKGKALFQSGLLSEAVLALEAEVQRQPQNVEAWRLLGTVHAENDDDQQVSPFLRTVHFKCITAERGVCASVADRIALVKSRAAERFCDACLPHLFIAWQSVDITRLSIAGSVTEGERAAPRQKG